MKTIVKADRVICISRFTADEAIQLIGLPSRKIDIVYNGCSFCASHSPPLEQTPQFHVPHEFFLFVGSLEPGKNLSLLREVYQVAADSGHQLPPLLIVGARWEGVAGEGQPSNDWHYLGRQSDAILTYLYRRALGLVFPSKYEGFGLPVVEAMSLGCPVICSPVASLPEVAGDAALYAKMNANDYRDAIIRLSSETELRKELIERGYRQSQKFSWKKCADETSRVYRAASASP